MIATPCSAEPQVIAVEGLCFAGKTTLARLLARRLGAWLVVEYADMIALPPFPPATGAAARARLSALLAADAVRAGRARGAGTRLAVFDRSPLSVVGHEHAMRARGIPADTDYAAQFQALPPDLFSPGELSALAAEAARLTSRIGTQLEHGDAHPGNALVQPGSPLALIDLELLAPRLPGYDLAVLWTITGPSPELRSRITARTGPGPHRQAAFWLNVILAAGREILSHRRSAPTALHRDRLARLLADLEETRARARQALMPGPDEGHLP